jgi:thiopeptide-type bacteriocin biosynthesis protein
VCLVDLDHELPIDLDDESMIGVFLGQLRDGEPATLTELFPGPDRLCAVGADGRYVHELVVPFVRQAPVEGSMSGPGEAGRIDPPSSPGRATGPIAPRVFLPGSDWLTVKLYAGPLAVDHLIRDVVGPLSIALTAEGLIRRWFFVRYADPHWHLRLRLAGEPDVLQAGVLPRVRDAVRPLVDDGQVWKIQLDTYEREVERYGGDAGIHLCEQLFCHDSEAVVELLRLPDGDPRGDRRWRLVLLGMNRLLDDLGLDPEARLAVLRRARDGFRVEFRLNGPAAGRLGAKYRGESAGLRELLGTTTDRKWSEASAVLDRRSHAGGPVAVRLNVHDQQGQLTTTVPDLALSLLLARSSPGGRSKESVPCSAVNDWI